MDIRFKATGLDDALESLRALGEGLAPRALADALNHTANQARQALRAEMESVFENPTPWVLNSTRIINAKPNRDLDQIEAIVTVKDADLGSKGEGFTNWFSPQVYGSSRLNKGSEKRLREKGILPRGSFIAPARETPRDASGNISRAWMNKLISGLGAGLELGSHHNATSSKRSEAKGNAQAFFVIKRGGVPIGIGERRRKGLGSRPHWRVVLVFTRGEPKYQARYKFHDVVRRVAENDSMLESNIDKAITDALAGRLPASFKRGPR